MQFQNSHDPLYRSIIFPKRGMLSLLSSERDEVEVLEEHILDLLSQKNIREVAMRPAGGISGLANPSAFFSNLEHAFGVWLLGQLALRHFKVKKQILYRWLHGGKNDSLVGDFFLATFLRGLFFTTFNDISQFCEEGVRNSFRELLLKEIRNVLDKWESKPPGINKENVLFLLGDRIKKINPKIAILKEIFFENGLVDLCFLDLTLRAAFYIGSPMGKALGVDQTTGKTETLVTKLRAFFAYLSLDERRNEEADKEKTKLSVSVINDKIIPIGKAVLGTCREFIIKTAEREADLGYTSIGLTLKDRPGLLLKGFLAYSLENPEEFNKPNLLICQGSLRPEVNENKISADLDRLFTGEDANLRKKVRVLTGRRFPKNFLNLNEASGEHDRYREFCLNLMPPDGAILLGQDALPNLTTVQKKLRKKANAWFNDPRMIQPKNL